MDTKKIMNNIKEKIALDNFKKDNQKRKKQKRAIIIGSTIAIITASLITVKKLKENN